MFSHIISTALSSFIDLCVYVGVGVGDDNTVTMLTKTYTPLRKVLVGRCRESAHVSGGRGGPQLNQQVPKAQGLSWGAVGQSCGPLAGCTPLDSLFHSLLLKWSQTVLQLCA